MNQLVITGGSGGLGQAIIRSFIELSWDVRSPSHAELDVASPNAVKSFFATLQPDLLICAAGITRDASLSKLDENTWDELMAVNYEGGAGCAAAVLPGMVARGTGHIVFISSQSAIHPPAGQAGYSAAKAALLGLTKSLARRHGRDGIRVNAVLPGFLETPMTAGVREKRKAEVLSDHSLGRFNTPDAVAKFIRYLHRELPHTSGQVFQLDSRIS
jgi:3-oxoacyl-[acyl-carrier protein] reductase